MNCSEVQQVLPEIIDGSENGSEDREYRAHLKSCPECSELVSELGLIANESRQLSDVDMPADRVWVRIAAELRAEGIIREPEAAPARPVPTPNPGRRWNAWWLVPVAAALVAVGSYVIKPKPSPAVAEKPAVVAPQATQPDTPVVARSTPEPAKVVKSPVMLPFPKDTSMASEKDDQEFLNQVSHSAPMMRASYENQLQTVNSYIREAQSYADQNPGDEDARQHLMDAFEQKSMLYQMALDNVQ